MSSNDPHEPVTVTDKRRVDPETGQVREQATGPAPSGPAPEAPPAGPSDGSDKVAELTADLQRVQADFANYRKRALRDQQLIADRAKAAVITQLLAVLDDLDRARSHGDLESGPLKAVADKLVTALEGLGLSGFGAEGDEFDPALHEAVQHEGDGTHPVVGTVMRRGYKVGDQVVRHAMVGVVDTLPDAGEPDTEQNAATTPDEDAE
ncbi:nucleotide exchange factor GrpE [Mycobacterium sp. ITM-2016-00318]|uniref:nucleotide exchange factor GrpE n=1 Tax=Mycobacterium sp. ITM-2016-00318 TaxID=2099693 RepID=UPI000CFA737B|nr:nucleotide exchange factor GrpE [Mycobacterium sp. ITM-2016-00318]WNG93270.1 nucleotide exchange factor GrpE [Mycobacterium sp. ITM-2016-00318]